MSEVNCQNCKAACCQGMTTMELTRKEAGFMRRGGNDLVTIVPPENKDRADAVYPAGFEIDPDDPTKVKVLVERGREYEPLGAGLGRYVMLQECGYLKREPGGWYSCSAYDERPQVCRDFEMGEPKCLLMRKLRGVDD